MSNSNFYKYSVRDVKGTKFDMNQLKGKVVLVINTASASTLAVQLKGFVSYFCY